MPSDSINLKALAVQLDKTLSGGRIDKVTMPEKDMIVLTIRGKETYNLVLSANPSYPRCHLTSAQFVNPFNAPSFCMHLRKHIGGGYITSVDIIDFERIITFHITSRNELGVQENKKLIIEIMGKYSNIILTTEHYIISEAIKHISLDTSSKRQVLPNLKYVTAPTQIGKFAITDEPALRQALFEYNGDNLTNYLITKIVGFAPISIRECIFRACGSTNIEGELSDSTITAIIAELKLMVATCDNPSPCVLVTNGIAKDYFLYPYTHLGCEFVMTATMNEALDSYFGSIDKSNRFQSKTRVLQTSLKNALARAEKKLSLLIQKNVDCQDYKQDNLSAELLLSNIYKVKFGDSEITVDNYYEENAPYTIKLDKQKSAQVNVQRLYARYAKKKKTIEMLVSQIAETTESIEYMQSISFSFETAREADELAEIIEELTAVGVIKKQDSGKTSSQKVKNYGKYGKKQPKIVKAEKVSTPHIFTIDGYRVKVGKNNVQNDYITKNAKPFDIWLHTQKIHGSHTILECNEKEPPLQSTIIKVAQICAYYSKANQSENVPVDYTYAKFASKPRGAVPGKVIYTNQKTIYVNPVLYKSTT